MYINITTLLPIASTSAISCWIGSVQPFLVIVLRFLTGPFFDAGYLRPLLVLGCTLVVLGMNHTLYCNGVLACLSVTRAVRWRRRRSRLRPFSCTRNILVLILNSPLGYRLRQFREVASMESFSYSCYAVLCLRLASLKQCVRFP